MPIAVFIEKSSFYFILSGIIDNLIYLILILNYRKSQVWFPKGTLLVNCKRIMERLLAKISIRNKLTIVIMLASMMMLILVASAFVAVEIYSSRNHLIDETKTLARSLGANIKQSLLINDTSAANNLLASLQLKPAIRAAYLFNSAGDPVASYLDQVDSHFLLDIIPQDFSEQNRIFWTAAEANQILSNWTHLSLFMPLFHEGQRVGTLYLLSDLEDLYGRVSGVVFGVFLSLLILLGLSWYLAGKLQRPVSLPLMNLVDTMAAVSQQKDYRIRADKQTEDEIGDLVDGFNRMLAQIERHRNQLEKHQENLEQTVAQRTSELREMIIALRQTKQQLEAAGQAKSQFIASITHELRTPLVGVLGMNELLFRTPLNEEQKMLTETVQKSGEDLLLLINNILDFSRIEVGKLKLEPVEFEIHQLIDSVLEMLNGQAEEKRLQLVSEIPLDAAWKVEGDEVRLKQILTNLIGNAIKFTEQGEVRVRLSCHRKKGTRKRFEIQVSDTGVGMDEKTQQQIFSAFYQADSTSTRDYGGSGLGLAIVSQLVELMNGRISLESAPGSGSCFHIELELPVIEQAEFNLPEELLQQQVLICTVDCPQHALLAAGLTSLGMPVQSADSATAAWYQLVAAIRSEKPIGMLFCGPAATLPDGQPLYQAVRENPLFRTLRRVILPPSRFSPLSLERQETKLCSPFGWQGLCQTLKTCWHELYLVESQFDRPVKPAEPKAETGKKQRLLVAGGGVASRELVKLALLGTDCIVESAPDLTGILEGPAEEFAAILLDLPFLPEGQLHKYLTLPDHHLKSLIFYEHEAQLLPYRELVEVCLKKPFDREQLQTALDSLLAFSSQSSREGKR